MRAHRSKRGISSIIGTVLLVAITIVAGGALWTLRFNFGTSNPIISYQADGSGSMNPYGDGTDCKNVGSGANATQVCETVSAIFVTVTGFQPSYLPVANLQFYFYCEGTIYLTGLISAMEWVPGSTSSGSGSGVPTLGQCGSYTPPHANFNRFLYFQQVTPGDANLQVGDVFVISAQSFNPAYCPFAPSAINICWLTAAQHSVIQASANNFPSTCPQPGYVSGANPAGNGSYALNQCDDDYHGVPTPACYTVAGDCWMQVNTVQPGALALKLSFFGLFPALH